MAGKTLKACNLPRSRVYGRSRIRSSRGIRIFAENQRFSTPQGGTEKSPVYRGSGKANSFNKEIAGLKDAIKGHPVPERLKSIRK